MQDVDEEELIENADCECKPKHTGDSVVQNSNQVENPESYS